MAGPWRALLASLAVLLLAAVPCAGHAGQRPRPGQRQSRHAGAAGGTSSHHVVGKDAHGIPNKMFAFLKSKKKKVHAIKHPKKSSEPKSKAADALKDVLSETDGVADALLNKMKHAMSAFKKARSRKPGTLHVNYHGKYVKPSHPNKVLHTIMSAVDKVYFLCTPAI